MRELTIVEVSHVAGAGFGSRLGAAVLGAVSGIAAGAWKGTVTGGSTGGIVGAGIIGGGFGVAIGAAIMMVGGGLYGLVNDWDRTLEVFNNNMDHFLDMTNPAPQVA